MTTAMHKLSTVLAAVTVLISPFANRVVAAQNDTEEVRTVVTGFATTWNRHDLNAFGKLFATDADFVNVAGIFWKGGKFIQAQHAYTHGAIPADSPGFTKQDRPYYGIFKDSTLKFEPITVRFLCKEVAVAHVNWEMLGDSRTRDPRYGVLLFVLTREDAGWLIAAAQNTEIHRTVN